LLTASFLVGQYSKVKVDVGVLLSQPFYSESLTLFFIKARVDFFINLSSNRLFQEILDLGFLSNTLVKGL
jgi:hypothetical protein